MTCQSNVVIHEFAVPIRAEVLAEKELMILIPLVAHLGPVVRMPLDADFVWTVSITSASKSCSRVLLGLVEDVHVRHRMLPGSELGAQPSRGIWPELVLLPT